LLHLGHAFLDPALCRAIRNSAMDKPDAVTTTADALKREEKQLRQTTDYTDLHGNSGTHSV
jgi:hypothetical protein